jgi:hypothetical protein
MRAVDIKNFFFLSFTPCTPPPARAYARPRVKGVKEGKKSRGHGSSRADRSSYARGNSRGTRLTYFSLSERRPGAPTPVPTRAPTLAHVASADRARSLGPPAMTTPHAATTAATDPTPTKARSAA